jgi:xanthine dehydrogenase YagR molybdenum-binding subunit
VIFAGEFDSEASLLGSKGLGELTAVSVAPATINAINLSRHWEAHS